MPDYLLTITCQQKKDLVFGYEIRDIVFWLEAQGVTFLIKRYEDHGLYGQLHLHCLVRYVGRYVHLCKWGDQEFTHNTWQVHWKKVKQGGYGRVITYLLKQDTKVVRLRQQAREAKRYEANIKFCAAGSESLAKILRASIVKSPDMERRQGVPRRGGQSPGSTEA